MILTSGSKVFGTLFLATALGGALTANVLAESIATINGTDIDSVVFNSYLESRLRKPAAQATFVQCSPWTRSEHECRGQ